MKTIIACDMGRNESKFFANNQTLKFKSIVGDWQQRNLSSGGKYDLQINGKHYFIGDLAERESYLPRSIVTESKIHEECKLLCLTGIALLVPEDEEVIVATGLPIDKFNPSGRDEIVDLLKGNHTVTFQGCKPKQIVIDQVSVSPESGSTLFYEMKKHPELKQGKVRIINIGSRTINLCNIESGNFISKGSETINFGMLQSSRVNPIDFTRKVFAEISSRWGNYDEDNTTILFSGGGILTLEPFIKKYFKNTITSENSLFSDCLGFYELAVAKYEKMVAR